MGQGIINVASTIWRLYAGCRLPLRLLAWSRIWICPFEKLLTFVPARGSVLEVGCGTGVFANLVALANPERSVAGCDLSASAIAAAQQTVDGRPNLQFQLKSVEEAVLSEPPAIVAAIDLFHHLMPDIQVSVLRAIYERMPAGGLLLLKDIDKEPRWKYCANVLHDAIMVPGTKIYCRTKSEYRRLLEEIGFRVEIVPMHRWWYSHVLYVCRRP